MNNPNPNHQSPLWYVLHTKSRSEKVVNEILVKKTIEVFLPTIIVPSKRKDRRVMLDLPLFPGYVFVKTDLKSDEYLSILKTPGAVKLIGNKDGPVAVGAPIIESLQIMVRAGENIVTGPQFTKGEKVIVIRGPFTGVTGIFSTYKGIGRVVVFIDILGQAASVEVDEDDIERIL
ncbi:MAG: UpxY family transcription antiterminator [Proteobacteria bacterium]|nr:UpxY family transcription antiterminator [Pseudomonadota bacterium]